MLNKNFEDTSTIYYMKFDMISAERFKTHFMYTAFNKKIKINNFKT